MSNSRTSSAANAPAVARETPQPERPDLFVSYSRKDEGFVSDLVTALEARGKDVWIDQEDIRRGSEWWAKVEQGIEAARAFVAVLTPRFTESRVCRDEVEHAVALNKRIVPVLREEVDVQTLHERLAAIDWVPIRAEDEFERAVDELVETAEADLEWLDQHARLNVRAGDWERASRDKSLLLAGSDLVAAENWLARQGAHGEAATRLQADFILESRRVATKRQRIVLGAVIVALVVALSLAALAYWQRGVAIENERLAVENAKQARSRELAATSAAQLGGDPELALLLAVEAARVAPTAQAEEALRAALARTFAAGAGTLRHLGLLDVALSRDGRLAATASTDTTARVWDLDRGQVLAVLRGHRAGIFGDARQGVMDVELSADGRVAVTAGVDGTARVWDARNGRRLVTFGDHRGAVLAVALSRDGLAATGGEDGTLRTWDPGTGRDVEVARISDSWVTDVVFSPDGTRLAVSATDSSGVTIYDARTLRRLARLPSGQVFGIVFSDDGRRVATGDFEGRVRIWDARTGAVAATIAGHGEFASALAFDKGGARVASGGGSGIVKISRAGDGQLLAQLRGHRGSVSAVAFSDDGRLLATTGTDQTARVWDVRQKRQLRELRGHRQPVFFVRFLRRGRLVTAGADGTLRIWRAAPERTPTELRGHSALVNDVAFSRDGSRVATASADGTARVWEAGTGRLRATLRGHRADVLSVRFSPDGRLVLTVDRDRARLWEASSGRLRVVLRGTAGWDADFTRDSRHVVGASGRIWATANGRPVATVAGLEQGLPAFDVRPDGAAFFAAPSEGNAAIFAIPSGRRIVDLRGQPGFSVGGASFSPDGRTIAVQSGDRLKLWDAERGKMVWELPRGAVVASSDAFSPDSALLLATGRTGLRVWDVRRRRPIADLPHPRGVGDAEFSPDGRLVLTAGWDGTARVWEARTARLIAEFAGRSTEEWSEGFSPVVAFAASGRTVAAATGGRTAFVHACRLCAPLPVLLRLAEETATRELTRDERLTHLGG